MPLKQLLKQVLKEGYRTIDIMPQAGESTDGITQVGTASDGTILLHSMCKQDSKRRSNKMISDNARSGMQQAPARILFNALGLYRRKN